MTQNQKIQHAKQRFLIAALKAEAAMSPFLDKMESTEGQLGLAMLSGVAACIHAGTATSKNLANAIKKASVISGIPVDVLEVQAQLSIAMFSAYQLTRSH